MRITHKDMLKKIILDHVLPIGIVVIGVLVGIFFMGKWGMLPFDFSQGDKVPRTVDTPEYKALDSAYQEQGRKVAYMMGRLDEQKEAYDRLEEQKNHTQIIYKNENKRIESNTANRNFDELRSIIQSRR